jgi:hypothetical protein
VSINRISAVAALCGGVLLFAACDGPTPPEPVASITMVPDTATVAPGASKQISVQVRGADGEVLQGRLVSWSSSDEAVASVAAGLVAGRTPGTALITATSEGKSAQATITVPYLPPALTLSTVNGEPVVPGGTTPARDSVAATVRVDVSPFGRPIQSLKLLRRLADGTVDTLARSGALALAPGTSTTLTLHSRSAPSGRYDLFVQAEAGAAFTSPAVAVEVSRPTSWIRLLSINGQAVPAGSTPAVADSFRVTVALAVADTASSHSVVAMRRAHPEYGFVYLGVMRDSVAPGATAHVTFTAYAAPAGSYSVWATANVIRSTRARATGAAVTAQVSQSDVTPPALSITSPVQGTTVTTPNPNITFTASDARGIWFFGYSVPGACSTTAMLGVAGPHTTATYALNEKICGLREGENHVTIWVEDTAANRSSQTILVTYRPLSASTSAPPPAAVTGAVRWRPTVENGRDVHRVERGHQPGS